MNFSHVMSINNIFFSTSLPPDHTHMLCKSLITSLFFAMEAYYQTAKGSFPLHFLIHTKILLKKKENHFSIFLFSFVFSSVKTMTMYLWDSGAL